MHAREIHINGIVQGVGFRPHVARLARSHGCTGWVLNSANGVIVHVQHADSNVLAHFEKALVEEAPPAARILAFRASNAAIEDVGAFEIRASEHESARTTLVSPDLATCPDCLRELFDPKDRRYRYPFINCTNCGPRFTIIEDLPYDRPVTSMREFEMCPACAAEYADDVDRRYHAQPNACFACGPRLWWLNARETAHAQIKGSEFVVDNAHISRTESDALIERTARELENGHILAIKGLGGWHLACDATNEKAVATLRARKRRPTKPLAIMVRDLDAARELAYINEREAELLESVERPIVLLERLENAKIARGVADGLPEIGIMLPATPVQHLIMHASDRLLVMTSGNRSGEPIVASDRDAFEALGEIADGFLGNNRAIVARYDDSVVRVLGDGRAQMIRRARGYAPAPLLVDAPSTRVHSAPTIFAAGPEQKSTFATLAGSRMHLSQHLGDLERLGAWHAYEEARERYARLFDTHPDVIACDMHPEYLASKWARGYAAEHDSTLVEVQHHHAHIASVLGENELFEPVIGIALDGTGYGTDGTIWGGELLIATRKSFERFWHLPAFKLPGGTAAIRNPARTAYALLRAYQSVEHPFFGQLTLDNPQFSAFVDNLENRKLLDQMLDKNINSPICSSAGRLFDAVSALLGICTKPGYDGEAACLLEAAAHREDAGTSAFGEKAFPLTARSFHNGLIMAIIEQTLRARDETGISAVALSGGCMVNRIVFAQLEENLRAHGLSVYANRELPPNDGCIAYGQAIVAQACLEE